MMADEIEFHLSGERLYGDDFDLVELEHWFEDEKEAYVQLIRGEHPPYSDHAVNWRHGFRFLPDRRFPRVLGLGSAYGDEFEPILSRVDGITILEPSEAYVRTEINGIPVQYVTPNVGGSLSFPDDHFDLATCFAVLHHIPNVSYVMRELFRCLKPEGYLLIHEPTVSMGDWRKPRPGLTKRERGIPLRVFREIIASTGFEVVNEKRCCSSLMYRFSELIGRPVRNSMPIVVLDELVCWFLPRDPQYHPTDLLRKVMVTSVFYVLKKREEMIPRQGPRDGDG